MDIAKTAEKLKKHIRDILPYRMVAEKKRIRIMDMYDEWKRSGDSFDWDNQCLFETVVSIEGFGNSGASAVVDLLAEYDGMGILRKTDPDEDLNVSKKHYKEINFLRLTGGLLQLEQAFDRRLTRSYYWNDALFKQFLGLVHCTDIFHEYESLRPCFFKFIDEILALRLKDADGNPVNPVMGRFYDASDIYYLKDISLDGYRNLCRRMLNTVFNRFHDGKSRFLILNQAFADCHGDTETFRKYIPALKRIKVCRDPRDVYRISCLKDVEWTPHKTAEDFILWTKMMYGDFSAGSEEYLTVRFESLVTDYGRETARLEQYLGLAPAQHARKFLHLNPEVSVKSVGQWRMEPQLAADFEKIKEAFPLLCRE